MSENLLPCPFCGKPAEARWLPINGSVKKEIFGLCGCNPCDVTFFSQTKFVEGQEKEALSQAIAAWNRRVTPQGGQPASLSFLEQREIAEIRNGLTSSMMNKPIWDLTEAEDKIEVLLKMLDKMQFGQPAKCPECGSNMTRFGSSDMCGPETITFFNECRRCKKVYPVVQPAEPVEGAPALEEAISKVDELAKKLVGNTMYESATRKVRDIDLYYEGIGCEKAIIILRQLSHPTNDKQEGASDE